MKKVLSRIIGVLLILAAIGGLIFSLVAMYTVWTIKEPVAEGISSTGGILTSTLKTTSEGIELSKQALESSAQSIQALQSTLRATGSAIEATEPFLDSVGALMKDELPATISATQSSLDAVQKTAKIIDTVLQALTIFNRGAYQPEQPLHEAIGDVSQSLNEIPASMRDMESSLTDSKESLDVIKEDLSIMADSIAEIESSVSEFSNVLDQYLDLLDDLVLQLENLEMNFPTYWNWLATGITIFLVWMAIAQLGLLTQGLELLRRKFDTDEELEENQE